MPSPSFTLFLASEAVETVSHDTEARISDLYLAYQAWNEFRHPTDHLDYEPFIHEMKLHGYRVKARQNRIYGIKAAFVRPFRAGS